MALDSASVSSLETDWHCRGVTNPMNGLSLKGQQRGQNFHCIPSGIKTQGVAGSPRCSIRRFEGWEWLPNYQTNKRGARIRELASPTVWGNTKRK